MSGVPYTTLLELVNGKTELEKCSVETVYRIAKCLGVSIEFLIEKNDTSSFEVFKSNVKHQIKEKGDIVFLVETYMSNIITEYWESDEKLKALYLLATVDYLSRINNLPVAKDYDDIRQYSLIDIVVPMDVSLLCRINDNDEVKQEAIQNSIPEFIAFNIVEGDLRNVA